MGDEDLPVRWTVVANVVGIRPFGPSADDGTRVGLKMFAPGARLYVIDGFGGMGWHIVNVVGRPRRSGRYVHACVSAEHLENWRVTLVHSPAALRLIERRNGRWAGFWVRGQDDFASTDFRDALRAVAANFEQASAERRAARLERPS